MANVLLYFLRSRPIPNADQLALAPQGQDIDFAGSKSAPSTQWMGNQYHHQPFIGSDMTPMRRKSRVKRVKKHYLCAIEGEVCGYMLAKEDKCFRNYAELKYTLHSYLVDLSFPLKHLLIVYAL